MRSAILGIVTSWVTAGAVLGAILVAAAVLVFGEVVSSGAVALVALIAAAGLIAGVLARILGAAQVKRVTTPLERLSAAASSLSAGNLETRAPDVGGSREVRILADSFNRMADEASAAVAQVSREEYRESQFVSDVSHELRTPLTAIRGAAETLLDGDVDPEDQERFLSTIATEAERLTRLANDLLSLQRIEGATGELPLRRVDLKLAAERACAMLEPLLDHRGVTLAITGDAPSVLGDVDRLQQVVANLVDNATRIVGEGGNVSVELSSSDGHSVLTVSDDGPGVPEADLPRLFDRFYRSDWSRTRTSGGAGLGLSIVRAIVTAHAGTIEAHNRSEGGSCFTVRLPSLPD